VELQDRLSQLRLKMLALPYASFKKTAAAKRLKELAVLGGGNSDPKPL
jgi:hypothetical protein